MKADNFANRLKKAMNIRGLKQIDLVNKTGIDKTLLNKYLKGISEAKQDNLTILAEALNVNEVWLMGYDVPIENKAEDNDPINNIIKDIKYEGIEELVKWDKKNGCNLISCISFKDIITIFWEESFEINIKKCEIAEQIHHSKDKLKNELKNSNYIIGINQDLDKILYDSNDYSLDDKKNKLLVCINKMYTKDELLDVFSKQENFEIKNSSTGKKITDIAKRKKVIKNYIEEILKICKSKQLMKNENQDK